MSRPLKYPLGYPPAGSASQTQREAWADMIESVVLWSKRMNHQEAKSLAHIARAIRGELDEQLR